MDKGAASCLLSSFFLLDHSQMGSLLCGSSFACVVYNSLLVSFLRSTIKGGAGATPIESKESQEHVDLSRGTVQSVHPVLECLMETRTMMRSLD